MKRNLFFVIGAMLLMMAGTNDGRHDDDSLQQ